MAEPNEAPQEPAPFEGQAEVPPPGPAPFEDEGTQHVEMSQEARNMALLCHLLGLVGFFAPLVIWLIEKDKHRFVDEHGREAMNYQVSLMIYYLASLVLCPLIIGFFLLAVLIVAHVVLTLSLIHI